jgi:hypothetical protein
MWRTKDGAGYTGRMVHDARMALSDATTHREASLNTPITHALNALPAQGFVRLKQIIGDPKATPPLPPIIPVSRATWYAGMKAGRYPKPVPLGARARGYRVEEIRALLERDAA